MVGAAGVRLRPRAPAGRPTGVRRRAQPLVSMARSESCSHGGSADANRHLAHRLANHDEALHRGVFRLSLQQAARWSRGRTCRGQTPFRMNHINHLGPFPKTTKGNAYVIVCHRIILAVRGCPGGAVGDRHAERAGAELWQSSGYCE